MALKKSSDPEIKKLRDEIILESGMKINKLTLIEKIGSSWKCQCDCGNIIIVNRPYRLKNELIGNVQDHVGSCGCLQKKVFKSANRLGTIETKYQEKTYGGATILYKTDYIDNNRSTIVIAKCKICHKPFPTSVRHTTDTCGCTHNNQSLSLEEYILKNNCKSKDEQKIYDLLTKENIPFIYDKKFQDCMDKAYLPFDFYINDKYIVEYDGEQHFKNTKFFDFYKCKKHDLIKNKYCFDNNIPLIRIPYDTEYTLDDLKLETTRFLLTPENEKEYYESRM